MDEDQLANMLNNPHVAQQMNEMLNNDQFVDMMIQSNPMLRNNPNAREMVRSPLFRHMMTNPEALRSAARVQRMMRGNGGQGAFPMPGVTDTTPGATNSSNNNDATNSSGAQGQANSLPPELAALFGGMGDQSNPFVTLRGFQGTPFARQPDTGAQATSNPGTNTASNDTGASTTTNAQGASSPPPNPFANLFGGGAGANQNAANNLYGLPPVNMTPEGLQQMLQLLGAGGSGSPPAPADNRPPEERYAEQLRQLNDMGFYDFDRNVAALRRSGGSVQGAIEHLLSS